MNVKQITIEENPRFCTVRDMNYTGEVMHGEFDGTHYVMEDGDCYLPETLKHHYEPEFSDTAPTTKEEETHL